MIDPDAAARMTGDIVVDADGREVGTVTEVHLDDRTGRPAWAAVDTGPSGSGTALVPLAQAEFMGNRLRIPYDRAVVAAAPRVEVGSGRLRREAAAELDGYYGIPAEAAGTELIRSAEQLRVGTEWVGTERVRLRKVVVTENVTVTVPVSHEELRVERLPVDGDGTASATGAPAAPVEHLEFVLHTQRPVVTTEVVPVERVRVSTVTVTEQTTVTEPVREERIDVETDLRPSTGRG